MFSESIIYQINSKKFTLLYLQKTLIANFFTFGTDMYLMLPTQSDCLTGANHVQTIRSSVTNNMNNSCDISDRVLRNHLSKKMQTIRIFMSNTA